MKKNWVQKSHGTVPLSDVKFSFFSGPDGMPINEDETKINMEEYFGEDYDDYPEEYLPYQAPLLHSTNSFRNKSVIKFLANKIF